MALRDLEIDRDRLAAICREHGVSRLEVFGSFVHGDADSDSDLDLMVAFRPGAEISLAVFISLRQKLSELFGRPVDLLTRTSVELSPNKYFRRFATRKTEPIYEQA